MPLTILWPEPCAPDRPTVFRDAGIRRPREARRLSQRRLAPLAIADLAGVDWASLTRVEGERSRGNLELVEKVVAVPGYELDLVWPCFGGRTLPPPSHVGLSPQTT